MSNAGCIAGTRRPGRRHLARFRCQLPHAIALLVGCTAECAATAWPVECKGAYQSWPCSFMQLEPLDVVEKRNPRARSGPPMKLYSKAQVQQGGCRAALC